MSEAIDDVFERAGCTGAIHVHSLRDDRDAALGADDVWLAASVIEGATGLQFHAQVHDESVDPMRLVTLRSGCRDG